MSDRRVARFGLAGRVCAAIACAFVLMLVVPAFGANGRAVKSRVAPAYPEIAKKLKISGVVKIEATVTAEGAVADVRTVSGNHMLSPAAEEAVRKWKFASGDGEDKVAVDVTFALQQ